MKIIKNKKFANGSVYALQTEDGYPIETTSTFLPYYTKHCIKRHTNVMKDSDYTNESERWMIGVSCMSGCPVGCKFCATGQLNKYRNLSSEEMVEQVFLMERKSDYYFGESKENKINYTRMGEPFLNIEEVKKAIEIIDKKYKNVHHYISTIGIKDSDFSWIKDNITLQISLHSLDEERRNDLIPFKRKMTIEDLGKIRTKSKLQTTINLTLVDEKDFDIKLLKKYFDPEYFFIKLSPINVNSISEKNKLGKGIIDYKEEIK